MSTAAVSAAALVAMLAPLSLHAAPCPTWPNCPDPGEVFLNGFIETGHSVSPTSPPGPGGTLALPDVSHHVGCVSGVGGHERLFLGDGVCPGCLGDADQPDLTCPDQTAPTDCEPNQCADGLRLFRCDPGPSQSDMNVTFDITYVARGAGMDNRIFLGLLGQRGSPANGVLVSTVIPSLSTQPISSCLEVQQQTSTIQIPIPGIYVVQVTIFDANEEDLFGPGTGSIDPPVGLLGMGETENYTLDAGWTVPGTVLLTPLTGEVTQLTSCKQTVVTVPRVAIP